MPQRATVGWGCIMPWGAKNGEVSCLGAPSLVWYNASENKQKIGEVSHFGELSLVWYHASGSKVLRGIMPMGVKFCVVSCHGEQSLGRDHAPGKTNAAYSISCTRGR
jgi:hypothetical protein